MKKYRLKKIRTVEMIAGKSITDISKEVHIERSYLSQIISRKRYCSGVIAYALSKYKGKDIEYFFDEED